MKLLFICTHNRCRSIIAEAVCNQFGQGRLIARSAGSQPAGEVHPLSLKYLAEAGIDTDGLRSKSWHEHEQWQPDVVITVCDAAAGESCPVWFGKALKVHWGVADPSRLDGDDDDIANAFRATISLFSQRINALLDANADTLQGEQLAAIFHQQGQ
ncbi:MAG TPA: arsenate reductase ArsC [Pseudomonadales bacterium]